MDKDIAETLKKLSDKYDSMGQDINAYLDGLLLSNYLTYWDYIHLDTLLSLQSPKTDYPDETIFVIYHQITELYFKLCLHEFHQISKNGMIVDSSGQVKGWNSEINSTFLLERVKRINGYFSALISSFDIMINGMEKEQFSRFRMALLPASGFQSAQYRQIEIASTDLFQLMDKKYKGNNVQDSDHSIDGIFEHIYWKQGATEAATGKKTLTLEQFEHKYTHSLKSMALSYQDCNLWKKYQSLSTIDQADAHLVRELRQLDVNVNINWPLSHYKSAVRYLVSKEGDAPATGGTNWQKYLPPRFQKRIFYPDLWSEQEIEDWGKGWVEQVLSDKVLIRN